LGEGKNEETPGDRRRMLPVATPSPDSTSGITGGALAPPLAPEIRIDPGLARVVAAWPTLPADVRSAVLALVEGAR
jgi:hypothetical protein